jgi:SAM-dependent methyltransferase
MTAVACALCGRGMKKRFRVREFEIVRCDRCDLERVAEMPTDEALSKLYASGYFAGGGHGYEDYFGRERAIADDKARVRMDALERAGLGAGARVLEVGCADGRFLLEAARRGHRVCGVEWSREAREAAVEPVRSKIVAEMAQVEGTFDVFAAFDVIEHWREPESSLARVRERLRAGALVAVVVPVIDNANARWWPKSWDQYKPPEHLWFYSRKSIGAMIEKTLDAEVVSVECAWRRPSRLMDVALARRGLLARAEAAMWTALSAARWMDPTRIEDSALVLAKVRSQR